FLFARHLLTTEICSIIEQTICVLLLRRSFAHASLRVRRRTAHSRKGKQSRESIRTGLTVVLSCLTCQAPSIQTESIDSPWRCIRTEQRLVWRRGNANGPRRIWRS